MFEICVYLGTKVQGQGQIANELNSTLNQYFPEIYQNKFYPCTLEGI